jgi:hypothetical protein
MGFALLVTPAKQVPMGEIDPGVRLAFAGKTRNIRYLSPVRF